MIKKLFYTIIFLLAGITFSLASELRGYDEFQIPAGYNIPIMSLQEFSTAYCEEGEPLNFITTTDIYLYEMNVIPKGTKITGFIDKKNEPVKGTNASMKVFLNKMYLPDGFEIPIKGYIYTANDNLIGGEMTPPLTWNRIPHYQRWTMFRAMGVLQCVPGAERKMGEHVAIAAGANLTMVLVAPINMSHTLIN